MRRFEADGTDDMEHLKFDCYDLAAQSAELYNQYSKIQQLSTELSDVLGLLDPQIKSYAGLQKQLEQSQQRMAELSARFLSSCNALERATDVYYAAEKEALERSESLPVSVSAKGSAREQNIASVAAISSINSNDLILEDWLAELIYKQG